MILSLETATNVCSVALSDKGSLLAQKESSIDKSHATLLTVFIDEILSEAKLEVKDLDAVAVSKGPGSYTGLRIGVSTAKGLCYGAEIPLIGIDTLKSMYFHFLDKHKTAYNDNLADTLFCPMIDARRMEVYSSLYDSKGKQLSEIKAEVIDSESYKDILKKKKIVFFGNGADKLSDTIVDKNAIFHKGFELSAAGMLIPAEKSLKEGKYENTAYFEPFYLKDFVATIPKKKLLG